MIDQTKIPLELDASDLIAAGSACVSSARTAHHKALFATAAHRYDLAAYFFRLAGHDELAQVNAAKAAKCRSRIEGLAYRVEPRRGNERWARNSDPIAFRPV